MLRIGKLIKDNKMNLESRQEGHKRDRYVKKLQWIFNQKTTKFGSKRGRLSYNDSFFTYSTWVSNIWYVDVGAS